MKKPYKIQQKTGCQTSRTGRFFAALRRGIRPKNKANSAPCAQVERYQRSFQLKRLMRTVNFILVVIVVSACVTWLSFQLLAGSDIFRIAVVEVQGNRMVSEHQVLEKAGLTRGRSMLDLDTRQTAERIQSLSWVKEVEIKRRWPSTVRVVVREYTPLALINLTGDEKSHLYYIDSSGRVFSSVQGAIDLDFPVLSGRNLPDHLDEMRIKRDSLAGKGLEFLKLAAKNNQVLPLQAISEVQISNEKGLIVYMVDYPFPIYLGHEKIRERYYLLVRVLAQLYRKDKVREVKEIRMDYAEDKIMVASLGSS
jgi:hypothetical protein